MRSTWRPPVNPDPEQAIHLGDRLWWVGHYLPNDPFQCHVYLLEQGDQSVLFDPGSVLTFRHTLRKIEQVVPFSHIRYFVAHHQDPDITGALPLIDQMVSRDDAVLVTHWRAAALLKHLGLRNLPFWQVEDHDWRLPLLDRTLSFVFTPYAHFPGAFTTFDPLPGALLSSDLFGGFTEGFQLVAPGEAYFEQLRPFHEHYIPSRDVLLHALERLKRLPIEVILPQHGSIIPPDLVEFMMTRLSELDCGLYLLADISTEVKRLSQLNRMLSKVTQALVVNRDFGDVARALLAVTQEVMPVEQMDFFVARPGDQVLHLGPANRFEGRLTDCVPPAVMARLGGPASTPACEGAPRDAAPELVFGLQRPGEDTCHAVVVFRLTRAIEVDDQIREALVRVSEPIEVGLERAALHRMTELDRQRLYLQSSRDVLTGLYTRLRMHDALPAQLGVADRSEAVSVGLIMVDLDHFKRVNDTYGHPAGDEVLRQSAGVLLTLAEAGDVPTRLGGEEFAHFVFLSGSDPAGQLAARAEAVRAGVAALRFTDALATERITASVGTALRAKGEAINSLIARADEALYAAKRQGRDRVCAARPLSQTS